MPKIIQISVPPEKSFEEEYIFHLALSKSGLYESDVKDWYIKKRSVDARKRPVKIQLAVALFEKGEEIVISGERVIPEVEGTVYKGGEFLIPSFRS